MPRALTAVLPLALGLLLASACRPAPGEGPPAAGAGDQPLAAADLAAIRANDSAFASAAEAGNAAGVAATYVPDAQLMPPNAPSIKGRAAIEKFWGGLLGAYQLEFHVAADEIEGRGDLAYSRGHYTLDGAPKAKGATPMHDEGKFLEILRRQPDGGWRYAVDMYSSDLPAPGAK
jgi:ketosteroid isomerase-like protein